MRKSFLLIIMLSFLAVPQSPAQRCLPGQQVIGVTAGTVNGLKPNEGFHGGVAISRYAKSTNKWVIGIEYLEKRHVYKHTHIPQSQFTFDAGYYLKLLSDRSKMFFISVGASGLAGYETVNWNNKLLFDGATIANDDAFIYGGKLTVEFETFLTDRIIVVANIRQRLTMGSSVGNSGTQFGIGMKYIIN